MGEVDRFIHENIVQHGNILNNNLAFGSLQTTKKEKAPKVKLEKKSSQGTQTCAVEMDGVSDGIKNEANNLAIDVVHYVANNTRQTWSQYSRTMRRTVDELLEKHSVLFNAMVRKLNINEQNGYQTFVNVANEIFQDGQYNWGRIVAVYAFGGRLARYSVEQNMPHSYVETIGQFVGQYVAYHLGPWISQHGGWEAFEEHFPDKGSFEERIWKGLIVSAAFGIGALATMAAVR